MLMYLGDICKFRIKLEEGEMRSEAISKKHRGKEEAWTFYTRARTIYPFDGRIYNSFAAVCQRDDDMEDGVLQTVYYLMRSLACDTPHEAAREFLIDFFEELRGKYI